MKSRMAPRIDSSHGALAVFVEGSLGSRTLPDGHLATGVAQFDVGAGFGGLALDPELLPPLGVEHYCVCARRATHLHRLGASGGAARGRQRADRQMKLAVREPGIKQLPTSREKNLVSGAGGRYRISRIAICKPAREGRHMKQHKGMRPQDVVILLKIVCLSDDKWRQKDIANGLSMSQSEVSEALNRSATTGLVDRSKRNVQRKALGEFLLHGLKYVFPAWPGPIVRGMPTAHSAAPLSELIQGERDVYVWPYDQGQVRGQAIEPLYRTVPQAADKDECLHRLLALADALRVGSAREHKLATGKLKEMLSL